MKSRISKEDEINKRLEKIKSLIKVTPYLFYFLNKMKKIIDVGYLRDKRVETYLKDAVNNILVFHNYTYLEALKGADSYNMKKSLEIVAKYTNQIQALKGIDEIMKVDYNSTDFRETFIDEGLTLTLQKFCLRVSGVDDSDTEMRKI
ncbi:MAG: hypothetical protein AABY84_03055 [Candidatus Firestonebacteria bacterium]